MHQSKSFNVDRLANVVTGRKQDLFDDAITRSSDAIASKLINSRILITGGGGSIGSETVKYLSRHKTKCLHIADISENYLADLVRDLRNSKLTDQSSDIRTFTLDYGSSAMACLLSSSPQYDYVLNFAAHKHVRGERDGFSLLSMIDTNLLKLAHFRANLQKFGHATEGFFSVSTDKAANPTSVMGASKRIMEDFVFHLFSKNTVSNTSARFANVAFSNGSLLQSMLKRLQRGEALAVPADTKRYFISPIESGQLCVLSSFVGDNGSIVVPNVDHGLELVELADIAASILDFFGWQPRFVQCEEDALNFKIENNLYPVLLTKLDTVGEKPYEEFVAANEEPLPWLPHIDIIKNSKGCDVELTVSSIEQLVQSNFGKNEIEISLSIKQMLSSNVMQYFQSDKGKNLDQRM